MKWAVLALCLMVLPASADQADDLRALLPRLQSLPEAERLFAACPADIHATRPARLVDALLPDRTRDEDDCAADPAGCTTACLSGVDGRACLHLAITLEVAEGGDDLDLAARRLHAFACAMGVPGGCTNRAAGLRNVPRPGDALSLAPFDDKAVCLHRSFAIACAGGDSWGCAMLGQAEEWGEGTAPDPLRARTLYQRACDLARDPGFAACAFAREGLERLNR